MTTDHKENNSHFVYHNFDKIWKYFPVRRSFKELVKTFLFTLFPFFFNRWVIFQNWKNARVFRNRKAQVWKVNYWKRFFFDEYSINLIKNEAGSAKNITNNNGLAVVVHAFYADIFYEIFDFLSRVKTTTLSLYLTGPENILEDIKSTLPDNDFEIRFIPVKNHGRDILPFLQVLPLVFEDGHHLVLKMHTKSSNHLNRKEHWRNDLFSKLIGEGRTEKALEIFSSNPAIGMIGPSGNILPMHLYYAANGQRVNLIANRMGVNDKQLGDLNFVAGSMFYARKDALLPVLKLQLTEEDFEPEAGQTDGTMAHVVERAFAAGLIASGFQLADTGYNPEKPVLTVSKVNHFIV